MGSKSCSNPVFIVSKKHTPFLDFCYFWHPKRAPPRKTTHFPCFCTGAWYPPLNTSAPKRFTVQPTLTTFVRNLKGMVIRINVCFTRAIFLKEIWRVMEGKLWACVHTQVRGVPSPSPNKLGKTHFPLCGARYAFTTSL